MPQQSPWTVPFFLKNIENIFAIWHTKNIVKHIENLQQHSLKKIIGNNLSITDIAVNNWDLSIIGIAWDFLKLSIIVIALLQKGLSCPSLIVVMGLQSACFNG